MASLRLEPTMHHAALSLSRSAAVAILAMSDAFARAERALASAAQRETRDIPCVWAPVPRVKAEYSAAPKGLTHPTAGAIPVPPAQRPDSYG